MNAWKNEHSFLMGVPSAMGGAGIFQLSRAATLVGLEVPTGSKNLDIKPYVITDLTSDRTVAPPVSNDLGGDIGLDLKYGVTDNLVADLTVNTDFAQVEADEQQVNLTRFSLFFPEKREFFLENQGTFSFGGVRSLRARGGGTDVPVLFYSREIGLDQRREVPMDVGGRLTGRVGRFSVGFMNIQTGEVPDIGTQRTTSPWRVSDAISCAGATSGCSSPVGHCRSRVRGRANVRRRRHLLVLRQFRHQHLLGEDPRAGTPRRRREPSGAAGLRRRPIWCAGGTARGRGCLQSGGRVHPTGRLRTVALACSDSVPGRCGSTRCAGSTSRGRARMSWTAQGRSRAVRTKDSSASSLRIVTRSI